MNTQTPACKSELSQLESELDILMAVEVLEYNDKNYLSGDNKSRSEGRMRQLERCMNLLKHVKKQMTTRFDPTTSTRNLTQNPLTPTMPEQGVTKPAIGKGLWINIEDLKPPVNKLVYTRSPSGKVGVYTYYGKEFGWNSRVSEDNEPIAEWFEAYPIPANGSERVL